MRQIHDWQALKREFLGSAFLEVVPFLRAKGVMDEDEEKPSGNEADATVGWAKEKQQIEARATAVATETIVSKLALTKAELTDAKWAVIRTAIQMLQRKVTKTITKPDKTKEEVEVADVDAADLEKIWKMIKTENDEPTVINKSQHNFPRAIHKVEVEIIERHDAPDDAEAQRD